MSPSPPSRELVITYAGYAASPDGQHRWRDSFDAFSVEFSFLVTGSSAANLGTALASARTAYRTPFGALTVVLNGTTLHTFTSSGSTGLETKPEILKEEHVGNTGLSMRLTVRVTGGRPADNAATAGLREYGISVGYTPNRRALVTISGVFTAITSTGARAQYVAAIDALASAAKSALSITNWELVAEDPTAGSYNDKTLTFSRSYREIKFGQGGGGDDATIFEQQLRVTFRKTTARNAPGGPYQFQDGDGYGTSAGTAGLAQPLEEVSATYSAWIAFGTDGFTKWASLRSFVINNIRSASGGSFALAGEEVSVNRDDNKLDVSISGVTTITGAIAREYSVSEQTDYGITRVPAWKGNKYTKYAYQGPATDRWTRTLVEEVASGGGSGSGSGSSGYGGGSGTTDAYAGATSGFGLGFPSIVSQSFQDLFGQTFGSEIDNTSAGPTQYEGGIGPNTGKPTPYDNNGPGGGGGSGGGDAGSGSQSASDTEDLVSMSLKTEKMVIGLESPITITRTTRTQVTEVYSRLGTPGAFGAGAGVT